MKLYCPITVTLEPGPTSPVPAVLLVRFSDVVSPSASAHDAPTFTRTPVVVNVLSLYA